MVSWLCNVLMQYPRAYHFRPTRNHNFRISDHDHSYDTRPSILTHPLTSSITRSSSGEAETKRTKLTPTAPVTIAGLIEDGSYNSLQSLEKDVENAVSDILASNGISDETLSPSPEATALQSKVLAFRTILGNLTSREGAREAQPEGLDAGPGSHDAVPKEEGTPAAMKEREPQVSQSRTVLTLYGSAPPKQLFSSLQQPLKVSPSGLSSSLDTAIHVTLPLREATLPNIISTTEVYPLADTADDKKIKVTTIGENFKAPHHLPQISPPKSARPSTSKGNSTITFSPPEVPKRRKGSQSYAHQTLSAGFWLGYGGVDMPKDQTSPTARQKSRQRALSMGEAQQPPSETILVAVQQAKEDALFRSAYSSFAPTRDDACAIVPEETKNMVWWQKVGEKRFNDMFPIDPDLLDKQEDTTEHGHAVTDEDENFKQAVEEFVPVEAPIFFEASEKSQEEKETDEILKEISELLETLASHQRIRNLSLTTNSRTPVVQNSSLAHLAGSPSTPSTEEVDVYEILKSQLTLLITQLPPYAVAKLNGDQMEELNISRTLLFDTKEYRGVLEEDQLSRISKVSSVSAAMPATLARSGSGSHAHYPANSSQYSRSAGPGHHPSSRSAFPQQQQTQQGLQRSSSIVQRSPSGSGQTFQAGGVSYAPSGRPNYPGTASFNQQTPRASYGTTPSGQYFPQRSAQVGGYGGVSNAQYYNSTPTTQNRYSSQQNSNSLFSRPQNVAPMYGTTGPSQTRTVSPLKGPSTPSQSNYGSRTGYGIPASSGQMRSTYYGQSQFGTPQAGAASANYTGLPSNPQQMMIDRQQAQQVAQSQARLAAQNSFTSRQGSGTPQPPNGSYTGNGLPNPT